MKKMLSALLCVSLLNGTTQLVASAEQTMPGLSPEEQLILDEMLDELGYDSINDLLRTRVAMPPVDRIKDLNGDNDVSVIDAQIILRHLAGNYLYEDSYNNLDVTADYLIDSDDARAYLRYVAYYITEGTEAPYSASFGTRPPMGDAYETRTYVKYDYSSAQCYSYELELGLPEGQTPTLTPYTLPTASSSNTSDGEMVAAISTTSSDNVWIPTDDTRIVRIGEIYNGTSHQSTGFIIGEHLIATAAHCLYNVHTDQFNPYRAVWAYTYTEENGEMVAVPHQLTVTSVHIPEEVVTYGYDAVNMNYDYGLIVVEEDLTSYGSFSLGMLTSDAPRSTDSTAGNAVPLTITQYKTLNSSEIASYLNKTPTYRECWLKSMNGFRFNVLPNDGGVSGSPVDATNSNDTVVGIINSTGSGGLVITRPLLHFYLNNGTV